MPSGTAEPECRQRPPEALTAVGTAQIGADQPSTRPAATPESAHDPPQSEATNITARATIHLSVNGVATAGCMARSTAVI